MQDVVKTMIHVYNFAERHLFVAFSANNVGFSFVRVAPAVKGPRSMDDLDSFVNASGLYCRHDTPSASSWHRTCTFGPWNPMHFFARPPGGKLPQATRTFETCKEVFRARAEAAALATARKQALDNTSKTHDATPHRNETQHHSKPPQQAGTGVDPSSKHQYLLPGASSTTSPSDWKGPGTVPR